MSARQQFGSICAEVAHPGRRSVTIFAGGTILHSVLSINHAGELIAFWRNQSAAPTSGAMIEALKWAQGKLAKAEGVQHGA